eukprot:COSAG02_NODE_15184_length_1196_cov_0.729262_1_plen_63_part_00
MVHLCWALWLTSVGGCCSMWCMFPTMLMATNDVRLRDPDIEAILLNNEPIAVNRTNPSNTDQ